MLKGLLEGCILKIINSKTTYGYEICEILVGYGFDHINEGIVYPILLRLEKKEIITSKKEASPHGPKRKYYYLTNTGTEYLESFKENWEEVSIKINNVLGGEN